MSISLAVIIFIALFILDLTYFLIADHFNIIDKPNYRSSHIAVTIRGGGIIFTIAIIAFFSIYQFQYPYFVAGLFCITFISFLDDVITLSNKIRLAVHLGAVALLFCQWDIWGYSIPLIIIAAIFVIGTINAYNFMDGINGITGTYSLATVLTLYYINTQVINFVSNELLIVTGLSLLVFNFFNFRKKAKCFAGDVGSVSIAFILIFAIGSLIIKTTDFRYIFLLFIYGLDAVTTIIFRLIRKENIFEAHRSHFYQYLANEIKVPHLYVSAGYALVQLAFNVFLVLSYQVNNPWILLIIISLGGLFIGLRFYTEGKNRLLKQTVLKT